MGKKVNFYKDRKIEYQRLTDLQIAKTEVFRKTEGLRANELKERECLRCGYQFLSFGCSNRLCNTCNKTLESYQS